METIRKEGGWKGRSRKDGKNEEGEEENWEGGRKERKKVDKKGKLFKELLLDIESTTPSGRPLNPLLVLERSRVCKMSVSLFSCNWGLGLT